MKTDWKKLCHLTGKAIIDYRMINEKDHLLVGLSGGNDSMVLMHILSHLHRVSPIKFKLTALTINPGFKEFNAEAIADYAQSQGWSHQVLPIPINEIILAKEAEERPCSLCARLRRGYIYSKAEELGCNKVVLGQHLDDLCSSLLMGLFRGQGIMTMGANVPADLKQADRQVKKSVIRPLIYCPKSLIDRFASTLDLPIAGECDYGQQLDENGDRAFVERLVESLDGRFNHIRQCMLNSMKNIYPESFLDKKFLKMDGENE